MPGDFSNFVNFNVNYHHHDSAGTPAAEPYITGYASPIEYSKLYQKSTACAPHLLILKSSGDTLPEYEYPFEVAQVDFYRWDDSIDSLKNLLQTLVDGGNTWQLEAEIFFATNEEFYGLYMNLMEDSPYLSSEVLEELIMREDFPDMMLRNILVANPHAAKDPHLMELLFQHHENMLPSYVDDILAGTKTLGAKELMEAQISTLLAQKEIAGREMLQRLGNYQEGGLALQYMEDVLQNPYINDYKYFLADYYLGTGQSTAATQVLEGQLSETMENLGPYMESRHSNLEDWFNWRAARLESPAYFDNLTTAEVSQLEEWVDHEDFSGAWARSFLEYHASLDNTYNQDRFLDYIMVPEENMVKRSPSRPERDAAISSIKVYPNPVGDYTMIEGPESLTGEPLTLYLYTTDGKLLDTQANQSLPFTYNTKQLQKGAYVIKLKHAGEWLGQTKLIKL